jgi:hypothetical protein
MLLLLTQLNYYDFQHELMDILFQSTQITHITFNVYLSSIHILSTDIHLI